MFDILTEMIESDLLIPAIIVFIIAFLISFFKVKKLGTNLIVCAVCVLVYVICSFLNYSNSLYLFSCADSYLLMFICLFVGGFAISTFFGFAINTIIKLIKKNN